MSRYQYEAKWPELFEPAVVEPVVSFSMELARSGTAFEPGVGTGRLALPSASGHLRTRDRAIAGHGRASAGKPAADGIGVRVKPEIG